MTQDLLPPSSGSCPAPDDAVERGARAITLPILAVVAGMLGSIALLIGLVARLEPARERPLPTVLVERGGRGAELPALTYSPMAAAITPITSLTASRPTELGGSTTGSLYASADRIDIYARTSSSTATLNLVEYQADDGKWVKHGADCGVTTDLTLCRYVAKRGARYWHVYKASGTLAYSGIEQAYSSGGLGTIEPAAASGVTSVALSLPSELTVAGSPVTSSGTLSATWANQSPNRVFAGPTSGGAATPAFRALVAADLPSVWPSNYQFATLTGGVSTSRCYYSGGNASGCTNSTNNTSVATPKGWLPSGSVWTLRCGNSSTVPSGDTITISLYTSSTVNGTYTEDTGSRVSFNNASGSNAEGTATYTAGSNVWFLFSTINEGGGVPYTGYVNCALTRSG